MLDGSDDGIRHRPLPSVDIPLLRGQVRASRMRQIGLAVGGLVALVGAAVALIIVASPWGDAEPGDEASDPALAAGPLDDEDDDEDWQAEELRADVAPRLSEEPMPEGDGTRTVHRFGQARAFRPALTEAGVSGEDADALVTALTDVMDFRRCRPDHEMVFEQDADGVLRRFEYRAGITQIYEAVRADEGRFVGSEVEVPIDTVRVGRGGVVRTSLGAALERAGLGRSLVGVFVEVFEGEVNFSADTRSGDTFRILVDEERIEGELLRYGTVHAVEFRGQRAGDRRVYWFEPREDLADFYDESGRAVHGGWLRTPLRYDHISSPFDPRRMHPILRRVVPHNGVDYAASTGTPVWAAADGTVSFIGPRGPNGNLVVLSHDGGYETMYAHLHRFASGLERGDRVRQRQVIGYVGTTGRSTGPHLHFGLKRRGRFVDPVAEMNGPGRMLPAAFVGRFRRRVRELSAELDRISIAPVPDDAPEPPDPPSTTATD